MELARDEKLALRHQKSRRFSSYVAYLLSFFLLVTAIVYTISHNNIVEKRDDKQYSELADIKREVLSEFSSINDDLIYFSQSDLAINTLLSYDQVSKSYLVSLMRRISELKKCYDQVRILDSRGNEVIRINQSPDLTLEEVSSDKLQNKSERYYFKNASVLEPGEVYISKFDLNMENGEVEQPHKPIIRFSTPIHTDSGKFIGIGVINYLGKRILNIINEFNRHEGDQVYLINKEGYYLKGNSEHKEWTFMFPEHEQYRFSENSPELWEQMHNSETGKMTDHNGEYYFVRFYLSTNTSLNIINDESLFLLMHVPSSTIYQEEKILINGLIIAWLLIAPVAFFLIYKLAVSQVEQGWLLNKLEYDATHDSLTGLHNRQAVYDYLSKNILLSHRRNSPLSVGFIDINELKETNDQYGHEAGDELIQGLAQAIAVSTRASDFPARVGGDEFIIVFVDCDEQSANATMLRVQSTYCALGMKVSKNWSMSYGCSQLLSQKDNAETMIERADSEMYKQKIERKQKQGNVDIKVNKVNLINIRSHSMDLGCDENAVHSLDSDGVIIDVSPAWLSLTGYERDEVVGLRFTELLDDVSVQQVKENFSRIKGYGYVNNIQLNIKCKDGTEQLVSLNGTSKYDSKGKFERTYCEITSISTH